LMDMDQDSFQCPLLSKGAVPVDPATYAEAVTRHALGEQKKDDREDDYKQETPNPEPRWLSSWNVRHTCGSLPRADARECRYGFRRIFV
jgi:hypothetical protein